MEIIILAFVVLVAAAVYYNRKSKSFDVNNDGKVNAADVKAAVQNVVCGVKETADVNKDGKVDAADAVAVKEKVKTVAKKTTAKAKATVKKAAPNRGRKPQAK